jgi:hypothetical protein
MTDQIPLAEAQRLPVGGILYFAEGQVPENFIPFDGRVLTKTEYPALIEVLESTREYIERYWRIMGGQRIKYTAWRTPRLTTEEVKKLMPIVWDGELVLAIKAFPTPNQ